MIGAGTSGEVFTAQNIKNGSIFVVKKLKLISAISGIDRKAIQNLKVSIIINHETLERNRDLQEA